MYILLNILINIVIDILNIEFILYKRNLISDYI